jgi:redox-sensitive bicupin YhaK (pirin superfamily)
MASPSSDGSSKASKNAKWDRRNLLRALAAAGPATALASCARPAPSRETSKALPLVERPVRTLVDAQPTIEGAGVHLKRSLGSRSLPLLDPFLMLDEFHSDNPEDYVAGFPSHPHRGFETVTYMIHGAMEHRDSLGNHGHLGPGSTQWMTAGHGIIHSEMPQQERGLMWGFQLWVNLPRAQKLVKPRYQDLMPDRIPEFAIDESAVRLVAGVLGDRRGPVQGVVTAPQMLDVKIPPRAAFRHALPPSHNAFVYVFEGTAEVGPARVQVRAAQLAVLGEGDLISIRSDAGARLLCLAAQPIGEPVARYGPFVMNTEAELQQAVDDYRSGRLTEGG